ncbi:hypothetical protein N7509_004402 [Penicillium cosmopolitanum]|uniref:Uncharacterized protein n=1 Tax=Penicillium cosmopolitanum TaxID=1131564 RepID=A0A9X0BCA5_9EURO|nr:uncharacterized protein N7509_004402 [Penicillium cosmopolitanum]KAJ5404531.1 hypothetical protein N7509_004402 [Penicillium cosmopolitanum]
MDCTAYPDRVIPAMTAIYLFWTFGATGAFSVAGQAASRAEGLDLNHPRQHLGNMRGLPLCLRSAPSFLIEGFSGFAAVAALTQILDSDNRQIVNLLGLHVLLKVFVYYPSYILNVPPIVRMLRCSQRSTYGVAYEAKETVAVRRK